MNDISQKRITQSDSGMQNMATVSADPHKTNKKKK